MNVKFLNKKFVIALGVIFAVSLTLVACSNSNGLPNNSTILENALSKCNDTTNKNLDKDIVKRFLTYVSFDTQSWKP